jgi:hypothetical protein
MRGLVRAVAVVAAVLAGVASASAQAAAPTSKPLDVVLWNTIQHTRNGELLQRFAQRFPNSAHRAAAQTRLAALGAGSVPPPQQPQAPATRVAPQTGPTQTQPVGTLVSPGPAAQPPAQPGPRPAATAPSGTVTPPATGTAPGSNCFTFNGRRFCE